MSVSSPINVCSIEGNTIVAVGQTSCGCYATKMHSPLEGMEKRHTAKISLRRLPDLEFFGCEPWYNKDSPRTSTCSEANALKKLGANARRT